MIMWNNRSKVRDDLTPPCPRHPFSVFSNFSVFSDFFVLDIDIKIGTLVPTAKLDPIGWEESVSQSFIGGHWRSLEVIDWLLDCFIDWLEVIDEID